MSFIRFALLGAALVVLSSQAASADLVWSENFDSFADGDSVAGATSGGTGTISTNGTVAANAFGGVTLTADTGRDALQFDFAGVECGHFCYDVAYLADADDDAADRFFFQMSEGGRSTTNDPIPAFSNTTDQDHQADISLDVNNMSRINFYFNTSSSVFNYTGPDGSVQTVAAGSYDYWVDNGRQGNDVVSTSNGSAVPSSVATFVMQTFNGQEGGVWAFDNFELQQFDATHVPEPGSALVLLGATIGLVIRRRRS